MTKYYIDYISSDLDNAHHELVRRSDNAILFANVNLEAILFWAWESGIAAKDVEIL